MTKVHSLNELGELLRPHKERGEVIVHCHGVFDLLHIGHIRYLQRAKRLGEVLVVTLTADRFVNKGPHRPVFHQEYRADALAALDCVDYVAINDSPTAVPVIGTLRPDVYAKGAEFREQKTPELLEEEAAVAKSGGRVEFIEDVTSSSSFLLNNYLSPFSRETENYLRLFRENHSSENLLGPLEKCRGAKVLVVGEAIIDEYVNCSATGMSSKAPVLVARFQDLKRFAGGSPAVANHLAGFCDEVTLCAMVGDDSEEEWIRGQLKENVIPHFVRKPASPTIVKRRYRESYFGVPLFAVDSLNDRPWSDQDDEQFRKTLSGLMAERDLIVASDFGHGMLSEASIAMLSAQAAFLAVHPQANAANFGFHSISKYPRADYVCLAQREMEIEHRSRGEILPEMLKSLCERIGAKSVSVTVGQAGCLCYDPKHAAVRSPSLATAVADRVGAGDTFFALTALCAYAELPTEELAFLGNVAGAQAVGTVGHSKYLDEPTLRRHVESLLK